MASLSQTLRQHRSPEQRAAHRRIAWVGAFTSLWTPITVLAVALLPYLLLEELVPSSVAWAQPAMKVFAFLLLVYNVGLAIAERTAKKWAALRQVRHEAMELLNEVGSALRRSAKLDDSVREKVVKQAVALDQRRAAEDPAPIQAEAVKLTELASKQLVQFRKRTGTEFALGLVKALVVALLIRSVLIEPYRIPSGSMIPTLQIGDQIFVNKFIYGVRLPLTNWVPFVVVRKPERGDVIVFENPPERDKPAILRDDFIKRIAGIPGDVVELKHDVVYVNGVVQPRAVTADPYAFWDLDAGHNWNEVPGQLYTETLGGKEHELIQQFKGPMATNNYGPYTVPPGHVFVMGDNRDSSLDSRYGLRPGAGSGVDAVEFVPFGNIKGKAMIIWLSLCHGGLGSSVTGGAGLCTDRLFRPVR